MVAILRDLGLFTLRLVTGWVLLNHGFDKVGDLAGFTAQVEKMGFPLPEVLGPAAAFSEFAGGILLILGLLTPLAALFGAGTMAVAAIQVHLIGRWPGLPASEGLMERVAQFFQAVQETGWEFALALFAACFCILLTGPGRWSVDAMILRPFRRPGEAGEERSTASSEPETEPAPEPEPDPAGAPGPETAAGAGGEDGSGRAAPDEKKQKDDRDFTSLADLLPGD